MQPLLTHSLTGKAGRNRENRFPTAPHRVDCDYYRLVEHAAQISSYINAVNARSI